jgi:hypothetical protein
MPGAKPGLSCVKQGRPHAAAIARALEKEEKTVTMDHPCYGRSRLVAGAFGRITIAATMGTATMVPIEQRTRSPDRSSR